MMVIVWRMRGGEMNQMDEEWLCSFIIFRSNTDGRPDGVTPRWSVAWSVAWSMHGVSLGFQAVTCSRSHSMPSYRPSPERAEQDWMYQGLVLLMPSPRPWATSAADMALGRSCLLA